MRIAPLVAAIALAVALAGCAADAPTPTVSADDTATASATPTPASAPTPDGPIVDDPAAYPLDDSDSLVGVRFILADGALQCGIFDPAEEFRPAPFFGCAVNAPDFPYPPIENAALSYANAFISTGHEGGRIATVTDSTMSGQSTAPALAAGHSLSWSTVTCEAFASDEVRCIDADSGHGVRVSARDYEVF